MGLAGLEYPGECRCKACYIRARTTSLVSWIPPSDEEKLTQEGWIRIELPFPLH